MSEFNLGDLGELVALGLLAGDDVTCVLMDGRAVLMEALLLSQAGRMPSLDEGVALITSHWASTAEFTLQSQQRLGQLVAHFSQRSQKMGVAAWDDSITPGLCESFVRSLTTDGKAPSVSLQHLRRSALRAAFRTGRSLAFWLGDPTIDLTLDARSQCHTRPMTDDENTLLQMFAVADDYWDTRQPSAIALGQATLRTSEIPLSCIDHVDDEKNPTRIWTPGAGRTLPRYCYLTPWGQGVVKGRIASLRKAGATGSTPLAYEGHNPAGASGQASSCQAIGDVMARAGLSREADLHPHSVVARAGRIIYEETSDIEETARRLGCKSLDRAAEMIQLNWRDEA